MWLIFNEYAPILISWKFIFTLHLWYKYEKDVFQGDSYLSYFLMIIALHLNLGKMFPFSSQNIHLNIFIYFRLGFLTTLQCCWSKLFHQFVIKKLTKLSLLFLYENTWSSSTLLAWAALCIDNYKLFLLKRVRHSYWIS